MIQEKSKGHEQGYKSYLSYIDIEDGIIEIRDVLFNFPTCSGTVLNPFIMKPPSIEFSIIVDPC